MMPQAVLSLEWGSWLGVAKFMEALCRRQAAWAFRKRVPSSSSAVLAMTWHMLWHTTCTGPLSGRVGFVAVGGGLGWEPEKIVPGSVGATLGGTEIGGITVGPKGHVSSGWVAS